MSIAEKLTAIAENQQRIYQAGYDKGVAEGGGVVGDDYVVEIKPPNTIKTYTDNVSARIPDNQFNGFKELSMVSAPYVTVIGNHAFDSCSGLESVLFGYRIMGIGDSAFSSCIGLRDCVFDIANSVVMDYGEASYIGESAFSGCANLEKVDLKRYNFTIPNKCFSGCSKLKALIMRSDSGWIDLLDVNAFEGTPIESGDGYFYVPSKNLDNYKNETNWTAYANQFRALEDYTVDGTISGELDETKI